MKRAREADGASLFDEHLERVKKRESTNFLLWRNALTQMQCIASTVCEMVFPDEVALVMLQNVVHLYAYRKVRVIPVPPRLLPSLTVDQLPLRLVCLRQGFRQLAKELDVPKNGFFIKCFVGEKYQECRQFISESHLFECLLETCHTDILTLQYCSRGNSFRILLIDVVGDG